MIPLAIGIVSVTALTLAWLGLPLYIRTRRHIGALGSLVMTDLTAMHQNITGAQVEYEAAKKAHEAAQAAAAERLAVLDKAQTDFDAAIVSVRGSITPDPDSVWGRSARA